MGEFSKAGLRGQGFSSFVTVETLLDPRERRVIPQSDGVYVVVYEGADPPAFAAVNPAGWWKGRNPTLPIDVLRARWVPRANVVYIGKATKTPNTHLRERVRKLVRYGAGSVIGHEGGRAIWQLPVSRSLLVGWRESADAAMAGADERKLIDAFRDRYGAWPFGNAY